jgi:hypothetical protein
MPRIVCATDLGLRILFKLSILTSLGAKSRLCARTFGEKTLDFYKGF